MNPKIELHAVLGNNKEFWLIQGIKKSKYITGRWLEKINRPISKQIVKYKLSGQTVNRLSISTYLDTVKVSQFIYYYFTLGVSIDNRHWYI